MLVEPAPRLRLRLRLLRLLLLLVAIAPQQVSAGADGTLYCSTLVPNCTVTYQCVLLNSSALASSSAALIASHPTLGVCVHKALFAPFTWEDAVASLGTVVAVGLSAAGGLGGGGLLVPIFTLVFSTTVLAVPLSKSCVFGGALASLFVNLRERHPTANRPIIDMAIAIMFEPSTLAGTTIGVLANQLLPVWAITFLLIAFLAFTAIRMLRKGVDLHRKEVVAHANARKVAPSAESGAAVPESGGAAESSASGVEMSVLQPTATGAAQPSHDAEQQPRQSLSSDAGEQRLLSSSGAEADGDPGSAVVAPEAESKRDVEHARATGTELEQMLQAESRLSWKPIVVLVLTLGLLTAFSAMRGGHGVSPLGIPCGSAGYWLLTFALFPFVIVVLIIAAVRLYRDYVRKQAINYPFQSGDLKWTKGHVIGLPFIAGTAGIAAGLLGIGGGMVHNPILFELDVHPQVTSATSSFMVLLTAAAVVIQYIVLGTLPMDYFGWFSSMAFVGGLVGQFVVGWLVRKYNKNSIIVLLIGSVTAASCGFMGFVGVMNIIEDGFGGVGSIC